MVLIHHPQCRCDVRVFEKIIDLVYQSQLLSRAPNIPGLSATSLAAPSRPKVTARPSARCFPFPFPFLLPSRLLVSSRSVIRGVEEPGRRAETALLEPADGAKSESERDVGRVCAGRMLLLETFRDEGSGGERELRRSAVSSKW